MLIRAQQVWNRLLTKTKSKSTVKGSPIRGNVEILPQEKKASFAMRKCTKETYMYTGSFHEAIRPVLSMAQCFAVMPVSGVRYADASVLRFSWTSLSTWYSLLVLIMTSMYTVITLLKISKLETSPETLSFLLFFLAGAYAQGSFVKMARQWPSLMKQWQQIERELPDFRTLAEKNRLAHQFKIISITMMTLSLSEHLMNVMSIINQSNNCNPVGTDPIRNYFLLEQSQLYQFVEYSSPTAFFCKCLTVLTTFVWTFIDLFLILIGLGLSTRFRQINENLLRHRGMAKPELFWFNHRMYYRQMCDMCDKMDTAISHITLLSFGNNLFFVCYKLFNCFNPKPSIVHLVYFWFSLAFLIARTMAVLLYLSAVHDESKKPLRVFRFVPQKSWCLEVKRFSSEVSRDFIAMSGMRFFYITRKMLMSVTGTIVTYELVLLQFRDVTHDEVQLCD